MKTTTKTNSVRSFIEACWKILSKAKKQGATMQDLHEIAIEGGCPICTFSTFSTTFYKVAKAKR